MAFGITRKSHLVVGGDDWCQPLDHVFSSLSITGTTNVDGAPNAGRTWVEKNLTQGEQMIVVNTLRTGPETDVLETRQGQVAYSFAIADQNGTAPAAFNGGQTIWQGLPESASTTATIVSNVSFMPAGEWYRGLKVVELALTQDQLSQPLPDFTNTESVWIVVSKASIPSPSRNVTIVVGADSEDTSFSDVAIKQADVSGFSGGTLTGGTVSAALTGGQFINGYVLIGTEFDLPD